MKTHKNRFLLRNKKGALELSMNTIVVIVIGVAVLVLGLQWIFGIFGNIQDRSKQIDEQLKSQIQTLFEGNDESLAISPDNVRIPQKGDGEIVIAVRNSIADGRSHTFRYTLLVDDKPETVTETEVLKWLSANVGEDINLASGAIQYELVPIDVPSTAPLGTYKFSITLDQINGIEGDTKKNFIVRVTAQK